MSDSIIREIERRAACGDVEAVTQLKRWRSRLDPIFAEACELLQSRPEATLSQIELVADAIRQGAIVTSREAQWMAMHESAVRSMLMQ